MHTCGMSRHACVCAMSNGLAHITGDRVRVCCACECVCMPGCQGLKGARACHSTVRLKLSNLPLIQSLVLALYCSRRTPCVCRSAAGEAAKLLRLLAHGWGRVGLKHPLCVMSNACLCGCAGLPCICTPTQTSRLSPRSPTRVVPCCCVSSPVVLVCRLRNCTWRSRWHPCWVTSYRCRVTQQVSLLFSCVPPLSSTEPRGAGTSRVLTLRPMHASRGGAGWPQLIGAFCSWPCSRECGFASSGG
ncbi:hypothetical protein COO60DRAFT_1063174 [Scenedesmus sp. NREL 46B-D3]|nr:hypothetical protein COO60DRAFT_1063174 [Scenedesmus sp. NREL 46B-D3]